MSFLYPAFLIGALAVAIPIVLHFLRRDVAPEVPFSAVRLLQRSPIERSRRRRLRDILLLAARVVALLLLAAAFARPFAPGASATSAVRLIAIDRSLSMSAPGVFERALDLARREIDDAGVSERVAVIAFDERADVLSGLGSAADGRAALTGLRPGYGATRFGSMLSKAVEVADGSPGRLVVITDLQRSGWEDQQRAVLPQSLQISVRDTGAPPGNLTVASVHVEKDRLAAAVKNTGMEPRAGQLVVSRDGRTVASARYAAGADATVEVPIVYRPPASGSVAISLDDARGFANDNTRYVVLEPAPEAAALIVTTAGSERSGFYLTQAIATAAESDEGQHAQDLRIVARIVTGAGVSALADHEVMRASTVILLSTRGLDRRGRDMLAGWVRKGGGILIAASADVEPALLSTMFDWHPPLAGVERPPQTVALSATDLRHPIFRPFGSLVANLGQVRFERTWRVRPDGWDVAARFTDGTPALVERRLGEGRIVLFASDLDRGWNDFPLYPSFVPFALEAVRYVAGERDLAREYVAGGRVPAGVEPRPGVYRAQSDNRVVAVNVDPRESGSARLRPDEFEGMIDRVSVAPGALADVRARQIEARQSYWQYGLLLMLGALVVESFVGRA
jgi:hypothetical protein